MKIKLFYPFLILVAMFVVSCSGGDDASTDSDNESEDKEQVEEEEAPKNVSEEEMRSELTALIGDNSSWAPACFSNLSFGMTGDEVRALYPSLEEFDETEEYEFPEAPVEGHNLVASYSFTFTDGVLDDVDIIFHTHLDREMFQNLSLEIMEAKWGSLDEDERADDILTWINDDYDTAQRSFMLDHWEVSAELPE